MTKCKYCGKEIPPEWDGDICEECEMDELGTYILWSPLHPNIEDICGKK